MRSVRPWGLLSSAAAPVLLIGGWTAAAALQPDSYSAVRDTISALAARDAAQREVMTAALAALGLCHVATAAALRPAARPGRTVLAVGAVATTLVAVFPLPAGGGGSVAHTVTAALAFGALATWPLAAVPRDSGGAAQPTTPEPTALRPATLQPTGGAAAGAVLLGLLGWFTAELVTDSDRIGLAERVAAGAQALWPLVVVLSCRRHRGALERSEHRTR